MDKRELRDHLENMLLMVLENHQEIIPSERIDALTKKEMRQVIKWGQVMMYEASDNPCRARMAPKCLRLILPSNHYLQNWRKPKRRPA